LSFRFQHSSDANRRGSGLARRRHPAELDDRFVAQSENDRKVRSRRCERHGCLALMRNSETCASRPLTRLSRRSSSVVSIASSNRCSSSSQWRQDARENSHRKFGRIPRLLVGEAIVIGAFPIGDQRPALRVCSRLPLAETASTVACR